MNSQLPIIYPNEDLVLGESIEVREGVWCLTLSTPSLENEDYGLIALAPGKSTPEQLVWEGDTKTFEGFVSGNGIFIVERRSGEVEIYEFNEDSDPFSTITVVCGDTIKWTNTSRAEYMFVFEICQPKYVNGRFLDLE